jgi:hypothetical protein
MQGIAPKTGYRAELEGHAVLRISGVGIIESGGI